MKFHGRYQNIHRHIAIQIMLANFLSDRSYRPVTHYGMVIKRWNIAENNRRFDIQTYYEATDTFNDSFFKIWAKNRFSFLKMQGGPRWIGEIFILRSARLENSVKMTATARFIYNLWSNMYPNWLTLRDIRKKTNFSIGPPWPPNKENA